MARLLIHVEGQTEESFVNEVLRNHLVAMGYHAVEARLVGNARRRQRRGGIAAWHAVRGDILRHLKEDRGCIATTMVDYYGLPGSWPGRVQAAALSTQSRARHVQEAVLADLSSALGAFEANRRFIPFVVMHEFEALLFSDCMAFAEGICHPELAAAFQRIRDGFANPEEINDSPEGAPSKRVMDLVRGYQKPLHGNLAIIGIGLDCIRAECPHFRDWITRLEEGGRG